MAGDRDYFETEQSGLESLVCESVFVCVGEGVCLCCGKATDLSADA